MRIGLVSPADLISCTAPVFHFARANYLALFLEAARIRWFNRGVAEFLTN
jgi:hypothetical protein